MITVPLVSNCYWFFAWDVFVQCIFRILILLLWNSLDWICVDFRAKVSFVSWERPFGWIAPIFPNFVTLLDCWRAIAMDFTVKNGSKLTQSLPNELTLSNETTTTNKRRNARCRSIRISTVYCHHPTLFWEQRFVDVVRKTFWSTKLVDVMLSSSILGRGRLKNDG